MLQQIIKPDMIHHCYFSSVWEKRITTLTAAKTKCKSIFYFNFLHENEDCRTHLSQEVVLQHCSTSTSCIFNISCEVEVRPGSGSSGCNCYNSWLLEFDFSQFWCSWFWKLFQILKVFTTSLHLQLALSICFSYRKSFKLRILLTVFSLEYRKILFKLVEMHQPVRVWIRRNSLNWKAVFRFHSKLSAMKYHMLH